MICNTGSCSALERAPRRVLDGQGRGAGLTLALRRRCSQAAEGLVHLVGDVQPPTGTVGLGRGLQRAALLLLILLTVRAGLCGNPPGVVHVQGEGEGPRLGLLQQLFTLLVLLPSGYVQCCLSCLVHCASHGSPFQQQLEAIWLVGKGRVVQSGVPVGSLGIQVTAVGRGFREKERGTDGAGGPSRGEKRGEKRRGRVGERRQGGNREGGARPRQRSHPFWMMNSTRGSEAGLATWTAKCRASSPGACPSGPGSGCPKSCRLAKASRTDRRSLLQMAVRSL